MARISALLFAALAALWLGTPAATAAAKWKPLLSPGELAGLMAEGEVLLVDIRPVKDYGRGHVAGAVNTPYHAWRGPDENPGRPIDAEKLTLNLQQIGIEPDSRVVVTYQGRDAADFGAAARVYWTIRSAGVERVAILNGGVNAWVEAGQPLSTAEGANFPSDTEFSLSEKWMADRAEVEAAVEGESGAILIDARPERFFRGREKNPAAAWAGTLAGALNLPHPTWFAGDAGGVFRADAEAIRAHARAAGWRPGETVVSFCNTGHWAATNWFALSEIAGLEDVKLYPEGMVGWTRAHDRIAGH